MVKIYRYLPITSALNEMKELKLYYFLPETFRKGLLAIPLNILTVRFYGIVDF